MKQILLALILMTSSGFVNAYNPWEPVNPKPAPAPPCGATSICNFIPPNSTAGIAFPY